MFSFVQSSTVPATSGSGSSPAPDSSRIIAPEATPCYWYHQCRDTGIHMLIEDGALPTGPQGYSATSSSSSTNNNPTSLPQCARCGYTPRYDTILTNDLYEPVETLAGRNLLNGRFKQSLVRCGSCGQTTMNYLPGHLLYGQQDTRFGRTVWPGDMLCNNCPHRHISRAQAGSPFASSSNGPLTVTQIGCQSCTIVNPFGEEFITFLDRCAIVGGPLHRHLVAKRIELEIQAMEAQPNHGIQDGGNDTNGAARVGKKRKAESAELDGDGRAVRSTLSV